MNKKDKAILMKLRQIKLRKNMKSIKLLLVALVPFVFQACAATNKNLSLYYADQGVQCGYRK